LIGRSGSGESCCLTEAPLLPHARVAYAIGQFDTKERHNKTYERPTGSKTTRSRRVGGTDRSERVRPVKQWEPRQRGLERRQAAAFWPPWWAWQLIHPLN